MPVRWTGSATVRFGNDEKPPTKPPEPALGTHSAYVMMPNPGFFYPPIVVMDPGQPRTTGVNQAPPTQPPPMASSINIYGQQLTPKVIKTQLDRYVIGQEVAKRKLSTAVYNHFKRIGQQISAADVRQALGQHGRFTGDEAGVYQQIGKLTQAIRVRGLKDPHIEAFLAQQVHQLLQAGQYQLTTTPPLDPDLGQFYSPESVVAKSVIERLERIQTRKEIDAVSDRLANVEIGKQNILLIGGSGTGKTLSIETLSRIVSLPFAKQDASKITSSGYIGEKAEDIVKKLYEAADHDETLAGRGIAFIDEVDKIRRASDGTGKDVNGKGAQDSILKILEDSEVPIGSEGSGKKVSTRDTLFICAGAFEGLEEIVAERLCGKTGHFGLGPRPKNEHTASLEANPLFDTPANQLTRAQKRSLLKYVTTEDLVEFGMNRELIGRLPVVIVMDDMTPEMLKRIMVEPKNALVKQYQKLMEMEGVDLQFTDGALEEIATYAMQKNTGARGLNTILDRMLEDIQFEAPDFNGPHQIQVDADTVRKTLKEHFGYVKPANAE
jgi:ATP-dependent Clp protease ATP-binding subunit ClpX